MPVTELTQRVAAEPASGPLERAPNERPPPPWAPLIAIAVGYAGLIAAYWRFTADDALIPVRYAENLARHGEFVFNLGDKVTAMTSPLQGLLLAGFELAFGSSVTPNKVMSALAVLAAGIVGVSALRRDRAGAVVFAAAVLLCPFVTVWTVGGLETPYLLLVVTVLAVLACGPATPSVRRTAALTLLVGVAFLVRFDSIVFTGPLLVWLAWRQRGSLKGLLALLPAGVAVLWLVFSQLYYGEILPTSFYVKQPSIISQPLRPVVYELQFLVFSGVALLVAPLAWRLRDPECRRRAAEWLAAGRGWIVVGLAGVLVYGLFAGMKHMMFSYRLFVPYLPALVLVALELRSHLRSRESETSASPGRLLVPIAAAQAAIAAWIYFVALTPGAVGESTHQSLKDADTFMATLATQADEIAADWRRRGLRRPPRILTFTAGELPHGLPRARIYEGLVSYRKRCKYDTSRSADYVHGPRDWLSAPNWRDRPIVKRLQLVSSHRIEFGGQMRRIDVYFQPGSQPNHLSHTVDGPCV